MNKKGNLKTAARDVRLLRVLKTVTKTAQTVRVCAAVGVFAVIVFDTVRMIKIAR